MWSKRGAISRGVRRRRLVLCTNSISASGLIHFGTSLPALAMIGGKEPASAPTGSSREINKINRKAMDPTRTDQAGS